MTHSVTCKLNNDARQHAGDTGTTFFVSLGEKNFNYKTKENEYTNYEAALFAKDGQIQYYNDVLIKGAIIEVSGTGIIMEDQTDPKYKPKLVIQDSKLGYVHSDGVPHSQQAVPAQQAASQQTYQSAPQQAPKAPTQTGYWFPNGEEMCLDDAAYYKNQGNPGWEKGVAPPVY